MKKAFVLFIGAMYCLPALAQNSNVSSAILHFNSYREHQDTTELIAAKASIDEAAVNDKTKDEPKMYLNRGEIYLSYFTFRLNGMVARQLPKGSVPDGKARAKAFGNAYTTIDTNTICIAANSFIKVLQPGVPDYYVEEAKSQENLPTCLLYIENKGSQEFDAKRYSTALALYEKSILICKLLKMSDSASVQNIEMAASSADEAGNNAAALEYYEKLISLKYDKAKPYHDIAVMYFKQKDSAKAWDYIEQGRAQYPDDLNLLITETNFYITRHNFEKALGNLTLAINKLQQSPDKDKNKSVLSSLYSNLGNIYDRRANPRDDKGNDLPKPADYDSLFAKADTNYNRALGLTPDNFDVLYVTGALFFNRAVRIAKEADALPLNATDKYNKVMAEAKKYFLEAQPYFEKAHTINPNDASNTNALMQVYGSTGQDDKAAALGKK